MMKINNIIQLYIIGMILVSCSGAAPPNSVESPTLEPTIEAISGTRETEEIAETVPSTSEAEKNSEQQEILSDLIGPAPRTHGPMYFDPTLGHVVLMGGNSCENKWNFGDMDLSDIWIFNVEEEIWEYRGELEVLNPFNFGYDAESERVIFLTFDPIETWALDPLTGEAQNMQPDKQPPDTMLSFYLFGAPLAYDSESDRLILFGGAEQPGVLYSDTWAYDYNSNTWTNMQPENAPSERAFHSMVYDIESDRVILWGGSQEGGQDNAIWAYDYNTNTWESLDNIGGPEHHWERFGMIYHPPSDRVYLYTGFSEESGFQEEFFFEPATWAYDYNTNAWEEIITETNPGRRTMYSMAYDERADKVILFSGEPTSKYAADMTTSVWLFDPVSMQWTDVSKEIVGCPSS